MVTHVLETNYRGTVLRLEFEQRPGARLKINGQVRQERRLDPRKTGCLKLASTVQTDYEWHEFIEGIVDYSEDNITARLIANNQEVARGTFERPERTNA